MTSFLPVKQQMDIIRKRTVEIIPEEELERKLENSLRENKPLRIKLGCDPSRPDLHIGHSVVLQKLRDFQDLGHIAVLIIGDFTAMIGDPSGKNKTRPPLTLEETRINGKTYFEQASKILSEKNLEIKYNSQWLNKMSFSDVIKLTSKYTVSQILERDDFDKRITANQPISLHELLYPLSQAMDSVAVKSDVELGGTDQKFNLLVGRAIQQAYGQQPQCIITTELLEGTDGVEKMSKSLNNAICFNDSPKDIFGKTMSIPDSLILKYFRLATLTDESEIKIMEKSLLNRLVNPRDLKLRLAYELVKKYYGESYAEHEKNEFEKVFSRKQVPEDIPEYTIQSHEIKLITIMKETGMATTSSEAIRLIKQGAVSIDGKKITDDKYVIKSEKDFILKVGKRKFVKIKV